MAVAVKTQNQTQIGAYLAALAHLPEGGTLTFQHVPWVEYEQLLEALGAGYRVRISYDHGRLEMMMPLPIHEWSKDFIGYFVRALADELELDMNSLSSTTFKYQGWLQGLEPDTCFYLQNAARVVGVKWFDPDVPPPPPDIAVEIDITSESLARLPIYRNLGVPEIWRYDGEQLEFLHLTEQGYVPAPASHTFPFLTAPDVVRFMELSLSEGQSPALREFRHWVRSKLPQQNS